MKHRKSQAVGNVHRRSELRRRRDALTRNIGNLYDAVANGTVGDSALFRDKLNRIEDEREETIRLLSQLDIETPSIRRALSKAQAQAVVPDDVRLMNRSGTRIDQINIGRDWLTLWGNYTGSGVGQVPDRAIEVMHSVRIRHLAVQQNTPTRFWTALYNTWWDLCAVLTLQAALDRNATKIAAILIDYNIPIVEPAPTAAASDAQFSTSTN